MPHRKEKSEEAKHAAAILLIAQTHGVESHIVRDAVVKAAKSEGKSRSENLNDAERKYAKDYNNITGCGSCPTRG